MKKSFYLSGLLAFCFVLCSVGARAAVPTITKDPHDTTVCAGVRATFSVVATDTARAYQWQVSTDGGATWSSLADVSFYSGTHTDTIKINSDTSLNGFRYRAIASNGAGADTSLTGILTVNPQPYAGIIMGATIVCKGSSITLSDSTAGGVWSSANTAIATVGSSSGVVSSVDHGSVAVSYMVTNGCGSNTASYTIRVDTVVISAPITGPAATCVGSGISLMNANVLGTGTWSASNTAASVSSTGQVHGLAQGSVTITYDFTNACNSVSSTTTIQVDVTLNHGVISGPTDVCRGSSISLSETIPGGIWLNGGSAANIDPFGYVTGVSAGSTVISYYLSNGCGASIATYTVTVAAPASMITGADSVGIGDTIIVTDSIPGGVWSSANTSIAILTGASDSVVGMAIGTTSIIYTVTNVCGTTTASYTVHVGVPPSAGTITSVDSVCVGSTITLSDNVAGGVWSIGNTNASITGAGVLTGLVTGLATVTYTTHNAFGSSQTQKVVFVNQKQVLTMTGPSLVALGGNYYFTGEPSGGTFSASNSHMGVFLSTFVILGITHASFIVLNPGQDTITYSYTNSCGRTDSIFVITLAATGVNTVTGATTELNVYPNPNQGEFTLNLLSGNTEDAVVTVSNMVGEKVTQFNIATNKPTDIKLDQPAGLYFLSAVTANGRYTTKITITK